MKKLLLLLVAIGIIFSACENAETDNKPKYSIELSTQQLAISSEGGNANITVTSTCAWEAESNDEWISVSPNESFAGTNALTLTINKNTATEERCGAVTIKSRTYNLVYELSVLQDAFAPQIQLPQIVSLLYKGGEKEIEILSNFEYQFTADADWFTVEKIENGIMLSAERWDGVEPRNAKIVVTNKEYGINREIIVTQKQYLETTKIIYTSTNGKVVSPRMGDLFGANMVSNTYENGRGVITFDGDVTKIGRYAFDDCNNLSSITIPDSVAEIGENAFYCCLNLRSVTIGDSVTEIGDSAFSICSSLSSVDISDLSTWCEIKFGTESSNPCCYGGAKLYINGNELTELTIPSDITEIKDYTFYDCSSLTSITIPDSVTSIGNYAFRGCTNLTSATIGDSVQSIGKCAFDKCSNLTSATIGSGVTSIGSSAFSHCRGLTSVTIPDSVTSIGDSAFNGCKNLISVNYLGDLSAWCKIAFDGYESNPCYYGAKLYINGNELTEVTIPSDITDIKDSAFRGCSSLTSITIPDSVTSIGNCAFSGCTNLTSATIGDSVQSIGECAFDKCSNLTSATIGSGVTSIGSLAFHSCRSLTSVTIPNSVTSIGSYAFANCLNLKEVYCKPTTPPTGGNAMFVINASGRKIYVPTASLRPYMAAEYWSVYKSDIFGYNKF